MFVISNIFYTFSPHPSDPAMPGHLKVNCPKGKRGHPGVPLKGEAWFFRQSADTPGWVSLQGIYKKGGPFGPPSRLGIMVHQGKMTPVLEKTHSAMTTAPE